MKKLDEQEFEKLFIKGKGRSSGVFNALINLKIGEGILIEKKDWKRKAGPNTLVKYIEKKHGMKFICGKLEDDAGWAVKRIESAQQKDENRNVESKSGQINLQVPFQNQNNINEQENRLHLKSELVVFYLGRMAFHKIERIDESIKACCNQFWKQDERLIKELLLEIMKSLEEQGHIIIENEKTYIPLRRL